MRKTEGCETILYAMSVRESKLLRGIFPAEVATFSNDSTGSLAVWRPETLLWGEEEEEEEEDEGCCVSWLVRSSSSESKAEVGVISAEVFDAASN